MNRKLYFSLFFLLFNILWCLQPLRSQEVESEVLSPTGESFKTESALLLSWTIGESVVETYSDGSVLIVQGYHQPQIKVTPQANYPENKDIVSVFPNPAVDFITISLKGELQKSDSRIKAELRDLVGKVVFEGDIINREGKIDIHLLANGAYILQLRSAEDNSLIGTYKIEKYK